MISQDEKKKKRNEGDHLCGLSESVSEHEQSLGFVPNHRQEEQSGTKHRADPDRIQKIGFTRVPRNSHFKEIAILKYKDGKQSLPRIITTAQCFLSFLNIVSVGNFHASIVYLLSYTRSLVMCISTCAVISLNHHRDMTTEISRQTLDFHNE